MNTWQSKEALHVCSSLSQFTELLADKGYDSRANRLACLRRGLRPMILERKTRRRNPPRRTERLQPIKDDKRVHMYVLSSRLKHLQGLHVVAVQWSDALRDRIITDVSPEDINTESIYFARCST